MKYGDLSFDSRERANEVMTNLWDRLPSERRFTLPEELYPWLKKRNQFYLDKLLSKN
jgi:hypothetical protein